MSSQQELSKVEEAESSQASPSPAPGGPEHAGESGQALSETSNTESAGSNTAVQNEPGAGAAASASAVAKASRKRTKTGCLTCRKRRIKCGEERPICANCVKSKRTCEGYNQRVVFKDGINGLRSVGLPGLNPSPIERRFHPYPIQPNTLPTIAPAPPPQPPQNIYPREHPSSQQHLQDHHHHDPHSRGYGLDPHSIPLPSSSYPPNFDPSYQNEYYSAGSSVASSYATAPPTNPSFHATIAHSVVGPSQGIYKGPNTLNAFSPSHSSTPASNCPFNPPIDPKYVISSTPGTIRQPAEEFGALFQNNQGMIPMSAESASIGSTFTNPAVPVHRPSLPQHYAGDYGGNVNDMSDDEPYDIDEDGEILDYSEDMDQLGISPRVAMNSLLAEYSEPGQGLSFRSFLPDAMTLTTYYPSPTSSPLTDPTTARIFCHFVYVLGPSISIFERSPPNPAMTFTPGAGARAPQNVWSYTIPMLALAHPPLLHAVLALSSLHIARLTKGPNHSSLLHYHLALRRLGAAIADEKKRAHVATLAATLILAYYETMAAEHEKWASHILGAKQLLREIDFDKLSQGVESLEEERRLREQYPDPSQRSQRMMIRAARRQRDAFVVNEVDENLTNYIMGNKARGKEPKGNAKTRRGGIPSRKELETYQLQSDLFWWFVKMDMYQSFLSGNPLTLDYIHWGQCPPRARIGTLGTPYGSSDHLFLLMGRLADFQAGDSKRKRLVEKIQGGWFPPPEMGGPPRGMMLRMGRGRGGPPGTGLGRGGPPAAGRGGPPLGMGFPPGMVPPAGMASPGMGFPPGMTHVGMAMPPDMGSPGGISFSGGMELPPGMGFGAPSMPPAGVAFPPGMTPPVGMGFPLGMGPPQMAPGGSLVNSQANGTSQTRESSPPMYGMVPDSGNVRMPRAFAQNMQPTTPSTSGVTQHPDDEFPTDPDSLEAATLRAEMEWKDIWDAFQVFQDSLGPEYKPLGIEYMMVQSTPFGPALYYRTYSIATLQSLYLASLIILHRCHPSMPANVMMAASIASPKTQTYAIDIARITASLVPTDPKSQINPTLGASLIEATIPLFFAGVQYQDKRQREWLVAKLREITRLTGWASASRVLLGCQRAWEKTAEMGKGPPYVRPEAEEEGEVPLPGLEGHPETEYYKQDVLGVGDGGAAEQRVKLKIGNVSDPRRNFVWTQGVKSRLEFAMGLLGEPEEITYPVAMLRLDSDEEDENGGRVGVGVETEERQGSGMYGVAGGVVVHVSS